MIGVFIAVGHGNRRDRPGYIICENGCWEWVGNVNGSGYGRVRGLGGRSVMAHRLVYEQAVGVIPEGLTLDHLCRNRKCVRPDHLEPVDIKTNILRGFGPPALNARKTHCEKGHPLIPTNRERRCRRCTQEKQNRRRAERGRWSRGRFLLADATGEDA